MAGADTILDLPYQASAAVVKNRFVKLSGNQTVAPIAAVTDKALGVVQVDISTTEAAQGKTGAVMVLGVSWVEAAAAITINDSVSPSANGRAQTTVATQFPAGRALKAAAAAGDLIPVLLNPNVAINAAT